MDASKRVGVRRSIQSQRSITGHIVTHLNVVHYDASYGCVLRHRATAAKSIVIDGHTNILNTINSKKKE